MRKFIVLGIAKNIENQITILGDCLKVILDLREGSRAFIYEDGSTDKTAERLQLLSDSRITISSDTSIKPETSALTWDNKPCRLERIAWARNKCMEMWEKNDKEDAIVIWLDTDRVHRLDGSIVHQVAEQLMGVPIEVAAGFFAMSLNHKHDMYDTFAYRSEKNALGPEFMGEKWWSAEHQLQIQQEVREQPYSVQVLSACNGLAMYKSEAIRGLRFSATPTEAIEKYYRTLYRDAKHPCFKKMQEIQEKPTTHYEGVCLGRYCFGTEGLWYKNNSGYNQPVLCEWLSFHFAMRERGFKGLFIIKGWVDISGH
jgi:hypothetical protein